MKAAFTVAPLLQPFRKVYTAIMSAGVFTVFFSFVDLDDGAQFLDVYLIIISCLFALGGIMAVFSYYALELDTNNKSWTSYVNVFGIRLGKSAGRAQTFSHILISHIAYRDKVTPLNADDRYFVVCLIYDDDNKIKLKETSDKQDALETAARLVRLLDLEIIDRAAGR